MYKITAPDLLERLRHIAHSRGYFVKKDSVTGDFKVTSEAGEISSGHIDRLSAFKDICEIENEFAQRRGFKDKTIDIDFLLKNESISSLQIDETIEILGEKFIVDDISTGSGCVESMSTTVNLSDSYGASRSMSVSEIAESLAAVAPKVADIAPAVKTPKVSSTQYSFWN